LRKRRDDRIGEVKFNKHGSEMIIIEYKNCLNIVVQFNDGYITGVTYQEFCQGMVRNPHDKTIHNVGCIGIGSHLATLNSETTKKYRVWERMLQRCYDLKFQEKHPTYIGCTVCNEWHNYQKFGDWFDENYYEVDKDKVDLDKDILIKNNKIYNPDTCVFVPENINSLFTKTNAKRGKYPIGATFHSKTGKYQSQCNINKKLKYLGLYNTPEEAFYVYKKFKEKEIKKLANEYKEKIPQKLYDALCRYEVEITD